MTILAVEDIASERNAILLTVSAEGLRIRTASTGEAAVANIKEFGMPLLLIVDIYLGSGMDGISFFDIARSIDADLPVIFATGRQELLSGRSVKLDWKTKLLIKPYSEESLLTDIGQLIIYSKPQRRAHNGGP